MKSPLGTCHTPRGHPLGTPRNVMPLGVPCSSPALGLPPWASCQCPRNPPPPPPLPHVTYGALGVNRALTQSSSCSLSPLRAQTALPRPDRGQMSICSVHHFSSCIKSALSPTQTERPWASDFTEMNSSGTVYKLTRHAQRNLDLILSGGWYASYNIYHKSPFLLLQVATPPLWFLNWGERSWRCGAHHIPTPHT